MDDHNLLQESYLTVRLASEQEGPITVRFIYISSLENVLKL